MQIMSPHAWGTININETTRANLKSGGDGPLAVRNLGIDIGYKKVCAKAWQDFSWDHFDVAEDIKRRGCDELQHYSYKEDATKVYAMEMQYAKDLVEYFYPSDAEVVADEELQAFVAECTGKCNIRGTLWTAKKFTTRDQVSKFLGTFIYNATAGHAMYNNYGWDHLGYIPAMPLSFKLPVPKTKEGVIDESVLCEAMPHSAYTLLLAINTPTLTNIPEPNHPMVDIFKAQPNYLLEFPGARAIAMTHRDTLRQFSMELAARNAARPIKLLNFDPAHVAQSINL